jgi:uncharacterized protein YkwD
MVHGLLVALTLVLVPHPSNASVQKAPDLDAAAKLIVEQANTFRRSEDRLALKTSPRLEATAREFAAFMARTDKYGHDADGRQPDGRVKEHGYEFCIIAENIAYQFNSEGFATAELAGHFVDGWKQSLAHRKNLLDPDLTETGAAVAHSQNSGKYYAVQVFGRPRSATISFQIVNQSGMKLQYRLDDQAEELEPGFTRTFEVCKAPKLSFPEATADGQALSFRPGARDRFLASRRNGKLSVRKRARNP